MKSISTGIEDFKEMLDKDYYYVDKSNLISDVLDEHVVLYTRPRRFGKTLNMSMLYYFFSIKQIDNAYLFDGLEISKNSEAMKHQNKYPVIFISLKDINGNSFEEAVFAFKSLISELVKNNKELLSSPHLQDVQINSLYKYLNKDNYDLKGSLHNLTKCLEAHYHQKTIVIIDDYDTPLFVAYNNGYFESMCDLLGTTLGAVMKTNDSLAWGIMTGLIRYVDDYNFINLNNININSIFNTQSSNYFGFNQVEINQLLKYCNLVEYTDKVKDWYGGYLFGKTEIYNPYSVNVFIERACSGDKTLDSFWVNEIKFNITDYEINFKLLDEFTKMVDRNSINKEVMPVIKQSYFNSYSYIYTFLTYIGYLTPIRTVEINDMWGGTMGYELQIPNNDVLAAFKSFTNEMNDILEEL